MIEGGDIGLYDIPMSFLASQRYTERVAASPLVLVQEVLNTRAAGKPRQPDLLSDAASANTWLAAALAAWARHSGMQAPDIEINETGLSRLQVFRQRLELHLRGEAGQGSLGRASQEIRGELTVTMNQSGEVEVVPKGKNENWVVSAALYVITREVQMDRWRRLKLCKNEKCSVAFYDSTNNNNSVWHDVHICGNAANLRASRRRRAAMRA
jgi:predicted RNA-binding Zn ribbon-like protein